MREWFLRHGANNELALAQSDVLRTLVTESMGGRPKAAAMAACTFGFRETVETLGIGVGEV